jgi:hypothetical protein
MGGLIQACMTKSPPGAASTNIATIFSTADGEVLHVAPGLLSAELLGKELDFALSVAEVVQKAGSDGTARACACASAHSKRLVEGLGAVDAGYRPKLQRVHEAFSKKPLLPLETLALGDYSDEKLDVEATKRAGEETKRQLVRAFAR